MTSPSTIEAAPIAKIEELDSVLNGLEILKTNGGYTTDAKGRHWMTGVSMNEVLYTDTNLRIPREVDAVAKQYQLLAGQIKTAHHVLSNVIRSLDEELSRVHAELYPKYLQHGISSLPDEVLDVILEQTAGNPTQLRMVSRRFNEIVSHCPGLWANIDSETSSKSSVTVLKQHLIRSGQRLLKLDVNMKAISDGALKMMDPHWSRVDTLQIDFGSSRSISETSLTSLQLDQLSTLSLRCRHFRETMPSFDTWHLPKLTSLTLVNCIHSGLQGVSLTQLSVIIDGDVEWSWRPLFQMLAACPTLEALTLDFDQDEWEPNRDEWEFDSWEDAGIVALLPNLRSFDLDTNCPGVRLTYYAICPLLHGLKLPALQRMRLSISFKSDYDRDPTDALVEIFDYRVEFRYAQVHTLQLRFAISYGLVPHFDLSLIWPHFPNLRHLSIECPNTILEHTESFVELSNKKRWSEYRPPPLETIRFRGSFNNDEKTFCEFLDALNNHFVKEHANQCPKKNVIFSGRPLLYANRYDFDYSSIPDIVWQQEDIPQLPLAVDRCVCRE